MYEPIIYKEQEHRGYTCRVVYDEDPTSPDEWDQLGVLYSNHRDYNPQNHRIDEILVEDEDGNTVVDPDYIYVKVWAYIHSGIALSCSRTGQFSDPWDSGLFGIMAVHKDKAEKEFGDLSVPENLERVLKCLEGKLKIGTYIVRERCSALRCWTRMTVLLTLAGGFTDMTALRKL